jgi:hypothetical protein
LIKVLGMVVALFGLALMAAARREDGCIAAFFFLVALALFFFGLYLAFIEDGQGAARWLPFLAP